MVTYLLIYINEPDLSCIESGQTPLPCEWDYLQIKTPFETFDKLCNFVEKDGSYFIGQEDYTYDDYFLKFTYSDTYKTSITDWYEGKKFDSNIIEIDFATDNLANFYGFKLSWNVWSVNPCMTNKNTCDSHASCNERRRVRNQFKK